MTIASVGSLGTGTGTSNGTTTVITTSATAEAGNLVVVWIAIDNATAADGDNNEITGVTDSAGGNTWAQLAEDTNDVSGAGTGATGSIWWSKLTNQINSGGTITVTHSSVSDRAIKAWEYTVGGGVAAVSPATPARVTAGTAHGASIALSGLTSREYLFLRGTAIEDEALTAETATASYTSITGLPSTTAGSNAANIFLAGEFRILTGTGSTSNPTFTTAASTDSTTIFGALYEYALLTPTLYSNSATFYGPTITTGATTLTPSLFSNSNAFYAPTVAEPGATTFDPANKNTDITLSNGNLTATGSSSGQNACSPVKSTTNKTSGKFYFEIERGAFGAGSNGMWLGVCNAAQSVSDFSRPGQDNSNGFSLALNSSGGNDGYANGGYVGSYGSHSTGGVFMFAGDTATGEIWAGYNGTWYNSGDPAAGTGEVATISLTEYFAFFAAALDDAATARFASGSFSYSVPSGFSAWDAAGSGAQTLTPALFSNSATFYAPTITTGATTLTPSLYTASQTFYAATVGRGAVALTPALYSNAQTFYGPTVAAGVATLSPALLANSAAFYSATVATGSVTLAPSLFTNTSTIYAPTVANVSGGSQTLTPALFSNSQTFHAATVTPGAVSLAPALVTNPGTFYAASVTATITLAAARFDNASAFYGPTVGRGAVTLTPALFANDNEFFAPAVSAATAQDIAPARFDNVVSFYGADIARRTPAFSAARGTTSVTASRTAQSPAVFRTATSRPPARAAISRR